MHPRKGIETVLDKGLNDRIGQSGLSCQHNPLKGRRVNSSPTPKRWDTISLQTCTIYKMTVKNISTIRQPHLTWVWINRPTWITNKKKFTITKFFLQSFNHLNRLWQLQYWGSREHDQSHYALVVHAAGVHHSSTVAPLAIPLSAKISSWLSNSDFEDHYFQAWRANHDLWPSRERKRHLQTFALRLKGLQYKPACSHFTVTAWTMSPDQALCQESQ